MPRRRLLRLIALALEVAGFAAIVGALGTVSIVWALIVGGCLALVAAQFVERVW